MADMGELNVNEAMELFEQLGVKLSLTNLEANGKIQRGYMPIVMGSDVVEE